MSDQRKTGLVRLGIAAGLLILILGTVAVWISSRNGDVSHPGVEFKAPPPPIKKPPKIKAETFEWPTYGYTRARTRTLDARIKPPYRKLWSWNGQQLLEFSPILVRGVLYVVRKDARVFAISARTGRRIWTRRVGRLSASSPAYSNHRIFVSTLSGRIIALDAKRGRVRWAKQLGSRTESSPLVLGSSVLVGSESGTLYRLRQGSGSVQWAYRASGAIKGAPAYSAGKVFVGAYGGTVHAVNASNGRRAWTSSTHGARFGFGSGNFYATPAVAFGRVFLGNTDGKVYAFAASSGRLAWTRSTGSYVYSGAAAANVRRIGPTIFVGSYDGNFYALDARSGGVRWTYNAGGRISGAPSVIGDIVYFSDLGSTSTYGLSTGHGRRLFYRGSGAYNPMISDGHRLYWTGYESITALVERRDYRHQKNAARIALRQEYRARRNANSQNPQKRHQR